VAINAGVTLKENNLREIEGGFILERVLSFPSACFQPVR
jgi:hypothetical protein